MPGGDDVVTRQEDSGLGQSVLTPAAGAAARRQAHAQAERTSLPIAVVVAVPATMLAGDCYLLLGLNFDLGSGISPGRV